MTLKDKSITIRDFGLFTDLASKLVDDFKNVYFYTPWESAFSESKEQKIGLDFKGLKRVQEFFKYADKSDMIACFDTYSADIVNHLRSTGKQVWGAGRAEQMELERWKMRRLQKEVGLDTQGTILIKSIQDLFLYFKGIRNDVKENFGKDDKEIVQKQLQHIYEKYDKFSDKFVINKDKKVLMDEWLNGAKDKFVKSNTRGDIETFFAPNYNDSLSKLNQLLYCYGHKNEGKDIELVIEDKMDGIEPGFDGIQINGQFLSPTVWGIEHKGTGYIGEVCDYENLPKPIIQMNRKISEILKNLLPSSSFFSSEFIYTPNGKAYLIDPTVRNPAPVGSACFSELYENLSEIIWNGSQGKTTKPVIKYKYCGGVCFESEWAKEHELEVEVDPSVKQWVKFRRAYEKDGKVYTVPGFSSVCTVIALANTMEEVVNLVKERSKKVKAYELDCNLSGLEVIPDEMRKAKKLMLQ